VIALVMESKALTTRTLAILGIVSLAFLAGCGGGTNQSVSTQPGPLTPTIIVIMPSTTVAGGGAFTLTIEGANFLPTSMVKFGGVAPTTTFVNTTELTAAIPASDIASTGMLAVTVTNPAPGSGTSNPVNFTISPVSLPTIQLLAPNCGPAGVPVQLEVVGEGFVAGSVVRWNGSDRPTTSNGSINGLVAQISASDVATAGTAAVTVFNSGSGGGSSNPSTFTISTGAVDPQSIAMDPAGKFAYVASEGCDSYGYVSMYTINPSTGALASIGPPVPSNDEFTDSVTVDPSGKFVYAASSGSVWDIDFGSISTYTVNPTTGALTSTTGGIIGTGITGTPGFFNSVAVNPSGKFAYVANGGASPPGSFGGLPSVSMYSINNTTGALTAIGMIAAGTGPDSVAVDPAGKFAYVTNSGSNDVSIYTIDATTGTLVSMGSVAAGTQPVSVAVDPAGKFAYVTNFGSDDVSIYAIDAPTGTLVSMGSVAAGTQPVSVAVDPAGKFAYVTNFGSDDVSMYTMDATTGGLTPSGTIATGLSPTSIAIHPSGKFAYVTNSGSNTVSMYSIDGATGTLKLIGTIGT
jgi:YVTN family beta-propeller protein